MFLGCCDFSKNIYIYMNYYKSIDMILPAEGVKVRNIVCDFWKPKV